MTFMPITLTGSSDRVAAWRKWSTRSANCENAIRASGCTSSSIISTTFMNHPEFLATLKKLRIHPAWTPTEASWLNLIEAQFGVLKKFTLANTDDPDHLTRHQRIYAYLRYRHRRVGNSNHPLKRLLHSRRVKLEQH